MREKRQEKKKSDPRVSLRKRLGKRQNDVVKACVKVIQLKNFQLSAKLHADSQEENRYEKRQERKRATQGLVD